MFTYLRYFSTASFAVIVIAAVLTGIYYRSVVADDIIKLLAEKNNISFASGFISSALKKHYAGKGQLADSDPSTIKTTAAFENFMQDSIKYSQTIPVVEMGVYLPSGKKLFNAGKDVPDDMDKKRQADFVAAISGDTKSSIINDVWMADPAKKTEIYIRSFIPIYFSESGFVAAPESHEAGAKPEVIIELIYDAGPVWQQPLKIQMIGTAIIIGIFIVVYLSLLFVLSRAEKIISKQHDANLELAAAKARAETESEEKSKFLANISHELRTPLNAIIGFSEIIKDEVMGPLNNDQYKDYITDIHASGVHLLSLINDILDFSKAEAGKLEVDMVDVDVTKIMKASLRLVAPRAETASIFLIDEVPNEHFVVKTDPKRFKQVLLNLLSNSVKFTPSGGRVTLSAWYNVTEGSINVVVKDTGIGIAAKDISKVMATFGQVENEYSRKYEGTGLGLPLSKKLVELMGGRFVIESEVNQGTTVTIILPKDKPLS